MNRQGAGDAKLPEPDCEIDPIARIVVDAALEVHRLLGPGLLESVYEQALSVELGLRGIAFARQVPATASRPSGTSSLYLKASDRSLGLLINFNVCLLRQGVRRVIRSR